MATLLVVAAQFIIRGMCLSFVVCLLSAQGDGKQELDIEKFLEALEKFGVRNAKNFQTGWCDGRALTALTEYLNPDPDYAILAKTDLVCCIVSPFHPDDSAMQLFWPGLAGSCGGD